MKNIEIFFLKNKARVVLAPVSGMSSSAVFVSFPVGSRYESARLSGASHYIEHLMFKGTKRRKTAKILTREIDRLGAEYNAFTSKEYTCYYIKSASTDLPISLDILSDMLLHSLFDPKEMEKEKGPIIEELRMYKDNPIMNIDTIFDAALFAGELGRDIGGTPETVAGFVRDEVLRFRDEHYCPANMTITLSGGLPDNARELVEKYFGAAPSGRVGKRSFKKVSFGSIKPKSRTRFEHKKTDQVQFMIGFPGFAYGAKELPALSVLNTILGGSMSSRLFDVIREKHGLAYTVRSGADRFRDAGYSYVRAGLEAKNLKKAARLIFGELEKMKSKSVTRRELVDAKTHIAGAMRLSLEDSSAIADWYTRQTLFEHSVSSPDEYLKKIEAVSAEDVRSLARRVFRLSEMRAAAIGDITQEDLLNLL